MRRALFYAWVARWPIFRASPGTLRWKASAFFLSTALERAYREYKKEDAPNPNPAEDEYERQV